MEGKNSKNSDQAKRQYNCIFKVPKRRISLEFSIQQKNILQEEKQTRYFQ